MTKTCIHCNKVKDLSEFYGDRSTCKVCKAKRTKEYYYSKEGKREERRVYDHQKYLKNRDRILEKQDKQRKSNPSKNLARVKVRYALKIGKLKKLPCEVCADSDIITPKVEAHHFKGYLGENALNVRWLCRYHHTEEHFPNSVLETNISLSPINSGEPKEMYKSPDGDKLTERVMDNIMFGGLEPSEKEKNDH
jgi:hypothetical protein